VETTVRKITLLLLFTIAAPAFGDVRADHDAYTKAGYATALKEWKPLAEEGDDQAQYFLGLLYAEDRASWRPGRRQQPCGRFEAMEVQSGEVRN
jgi:hypothetical protein